MAQHAAPGDRRLAGESATPPTDDSSPQAPAARRGPGALLRVGLSVGAIVILLLWMTGRFRPGVISGVGTPAADDKPSPLSTETLVLQTLPGHIEAVGSIQAEQLPAVTSRVVANILEMRVSAGQRVAAGDRLVVLDDRDLRLRLEQAQEAVRGAEAALAQAQSDYRRDKPLFEQQIIAPYAFEHTQTNAKMAEADLHRLQQAEREAEVTLSHAVIRSPFTGVVVDRLADQGDLAAPGKPLLTMFREDRLWLEASVPEELLGRVRLADTMTLRIDALNREMQGPVVQIVPSSDPSTRTVAVRVRVRPTKDLVPGMFGRLLIPSDGAAVLTIPASALTRAGQLTMVEIVSRGRVERRAVQLGRDIGRRVEVLSGLAPGETIVLRAPAAESPLTREASPAGHDR